MANSPTPASSQNDLNNNQQSTQKLKQSAGYIVSAIVIALVGYFGWNYLQNSNASTDTIAAQKYASIEESNQSMRMVQDPTKPLDKALTEKLNKEIDSLVAEHGSTVYAWQALMLKARIATDSDDMDVAIDALKKALDIDLKDPGLLAITQLRYAKALLGKGDIEGAIKQASTDVPLPFEASQQEILGDIYLAQNKEKEAIRSYENAWSMLLKRNEERPGLRLKLESLGVTPEPIEQPPSIISEAALPDNGNEVVDEINNEPPIN